MVNKSLPQIEVSAICHRLAISPDGNSIYAYFPKWFGGWINVRARDSLSYWNKATIGGEIKRGIFKIRVVED